MMEDLINFVSEIAGKYIDTEQSPEVAEIELWRLIQEARKLERQYVSIHGEF